MESMEDGPSRRVEATDGEHVEHEGFRRRRLLRWEWPRRRGRRRICRQIVQDRLKSSRRSGRIGFAHVASPAFPSLRLGDLGLRPTGFATTGVDSRLNRSRLESNSSASAECSSEQREFQLELLGPIQLWRSRTLAEHDQRRSVSIGLCTNKIVGLARFPQRRFPSARQRPAQV